MCNIRIELPLTQVQVLAWNGGGSSNYSQILRLGRYVVGSDKSDDSTSLPALGVLKEELETVSEELTFEFEQLLNKVEKVSERVNHLAVEEFLGLFGKAGKGKKATKE